MKKALLFLAIVYLAAGEATATTHTVTVQDYQFSPSSVTARVGDTIKWVWNNGSHTTTSGAIPAGAATWDSPMTSTSTTFSYKLTVAGTYNYVCTPHSPMMAGTITAQSATGVHSTEATTVFRMYPNPAAGNLHIELSDAQQQATVTLSDVVGHTVLSGVHTAGNGLDFSTSSLANGLYIVRTIVDGHVYAQRIEIAH